MSIVDKPARVSVSAGLWRARSSIAVATGIALVAGVALSIDRTAGNVGATDPLTLLRPVGPVLPMRAHGPLTTQDRAAAELAWLYITQNTRADTGFVDSVADYPATTMWDLGSAILGIVSAAELGLTSRDDAQARLQTILTSLQTMPLFDGVLPNKVYSTIDLGMRDYDNTPTDRGVGWSALDIARLVIGLRVTAARLPELSDRVEQTLSRFNLNRLAENGDMVGGRVVDGGGATERVQEGRLGYEEYGARGLMLRGTDVARAAGLGQEARILNVEGIDVLSDRRTYQTSGANSHLASEPYLLSAFEIGLGERNTRLAWRLLLAQEARAAKTGRPVAVSEDHYDQEPYFLYGTVAANGVAWAVVDENGNRHDEMRSNSTKAAFGWATLWQTDFTQAALQNARGAAQPGTGWAAGVYEADGSINAAMTLNTNAVILEALHFARNGPLLFPDQ